MAFTWIPQAQGELGEGIRIKNLVLRPFADSEFIFETNAQLSETNKQDDVSRIFAGGVGFGSHSTTFDLDGVVRYLVREGDISRVDDEGLSQKLKLKIGQRKGFLIQLDQSYDDNVDTINSDSGRKEGRTDFISRLRLGKAITEKINLDLGYEYDLREFDDADRIDREEQAIQIRVSRRLTDKLASLWIAEAGHQDREEGTDADYYAARVGLRYKNSEKTDLNFSAGWRDHSEASVSSFNFASTMRWEITEKVRSRLEARNAVRPTSQNGSDFKLVTTLKLLLDYHVTEKIAMTLRLRFKQNKFEKDIEVNGKMRSDRSETYSVNARLTYSPPSSLLRVFLDAGFQIRESTRLDNDYENFISTTGVSLNF